jgi:hypothetical protein
VIKIGIAEGKAVASGNIGNFLREFIKNSANCTKFSAGNNSLSRRETDAGVGAVFTACHRKHYNDLSLEV